MLRTTKAHALLVLVLQFVATVGTSMVTMTVTMTLRSPVVSFGRAFLGQQQSIQFQPRRRFFATRSSITMMPEGPEVRTLVDQLQGGVGKRLVDVRFLSGRYVRNGRPDSFQAFAKTMTPVFQPHNPKPQKTDIITSWKAKGKFMYVTLDNGNNHNVMTDDFQRSIWITLGMTGQFVTEQVHEQDPRFGRWYLDILDIATNTVRKVYYHDQRNFGTLKFCLSKEELELRLQSLGPDILDPETTENDFVEVISRQRSGSNVCTFLMDQSVRNRWRCYIWASLMCLGQLIISWFLFCCLSIENCWSW
jgi:formamidopyrimidine-DNA glycosylase